LSVSGKRKTKTQAQERLFDTSKCQVKFRKARILDRRKRDFDQDRDLSFDHERVIDTRLQGVIFRDMHAVGFRNVGVSNIEEVSNSQDWPKTEAAKSPESLRIQRDSDWEETWGREETFEQRWGVGGDRSNVDESKLYLYSRDRTQPKLTYISQRLAKQRKKQQGRSGAPARKPVRKQYSQQKFKPAAQRTQPKPKVQVVSQPIYAPPSTITNVPVRTTTAREPTPSEKKRAFAFNEYALLLMESGDYDRAMNYFQKALDLDPGEETYKINMNRCQEWLDYKKRGGRR
jgi:tetratricopeptide (TPR) repeat protein